MTKKQLTNTTEIRVVRAVRAEDKSIHYELESRNGKFWIALDDLHNNEKKTIANIANHLSVPLLTSPKKNELKQLIESQIEYDKGYVATQQGYLTPEIYVHANGDITQSSNNKIQPIVVFETDERGGTRGSLKRWRQGISKSISGNKYITFMLCYGFCPMLLNFTPSYFLNPFLEILGGKQTGKTSLATMVASIYGGDPQSDVGYGHSWDATDGAFSELKRKANHGLLLLDENNVQSKTLRKNGKIAFLQSSTDDRKRMGDIRRKQPVRMALISTGNKKPEKATAINQDEISAATSRIISLNFDKPIIDECPPKYESTKEATRALRRCIDQNYGHAARAFVQRVVDENSEDQKAFITKIQKYMSEVYKNSRAYSDVDDRIIDTIALTYAAGRLAEDWKILPKECSTVRSAMISVLKNVSQQNNLMKNPELNLIGSFLSKYKDQIKSFSKNSRPSKTKNPKGLFGCCVEISDNIIHYHINPQMLRKELGAKATTILKKMRMEGVLKGQQGEFSKLLYPSPIYIPFSNATYLLVVPRK